jgi:MFS family permease
MVHCSSVKEIKMFKIIIGKLLRHRHFWRHATFDELSEIYISSFFRTLAISLTGVFISIFLYDTGYSLAAILVFYIAYFTTRTFLHIPVAYVVARIGPKHTILWSFVFQIMLSLSLLTLPEAQWPLWLVATLWAAANNLYFTAYHVDFSKIKHSDHGGKEMGIANIVQHIGGAIGPIVDDKKGRASLRASAVTDIFIQFAKPFVGSLPFALAINTAGETTATAMRIYLPERSV